MFNGTSIPLSIWSWSMWLTRFFRTADGAVGGTAQKVGGPFDKQGSVGQHFNADGKIGGMVQQNLAENKK